MVTDRISAMLRQCEDGSAPFPPSLLFNEDWLLRLVLDWHAAHRDSGDDPHPLAPEPGGSWYSEAKLPSAFLPRYKGDRLAEGRTQADGMVGHFHVGRRGATDLSIRPDARQLAVVEAKIHGNLSKGVRNAPFYDQAARSIACLAELLRRADRPPDELGTLGFYLVAPASRVDEGLFDDDLNPRSIRRKVQARVEGYEGSLDTWFHAWFEPTLRVLDIRLLRWEDVIEQIAFEDMEAGSVLDSFYGRCLKANRPQRHAAPERQTLPAWACPPGR